MLSANSSAGETPARPLHRLRWALSLFGLIVVIAACVTPTAAHPVFYGPKFRYYERSEIKSAMHELANGVQAIDKALYSETRDVATQQEVLTHLRAMESAAGTLALDGAVASNHPLFDSKLEDLRTHIAEARKAVEQNPPDYFLVGTLTGTCLSCHQKTRTGL